jgi:pectinesterase
MISQAFLNFVEMSTCVDSPTTVLPFLAQDTLYALSLRQFYSGCNIYGTVDYIFGNAAAVFQNCNLLARLGRTGSQNTYTASGRTDPGQTTGLSFLSCNVGPAPGLPDSFPTYLGRPWKPYAQTVFIKSTLASCINPAGWLLWNGDPNSGNTVNYGEYGNTGAGANTASRVKWSKQISITDANQFTVGSFIAGQQWLPATSIPYNNAL